FKLGDLTRGAVKEVSRKMLVEQLGKNLDATDAGAKKSAEAKKTNRSGWAKAKPKKKSSNKLREKSKARALADAKERAKAKSIANNKEAGKGKKP
ncbi:MAG: hypothetical protein KAQ66_06855, partial [Rhodospirillaceae bacterium]|nr:hypothetical protein [Rhodospirillaceae bacterium]